jgi:hypothetical protein
MKSVGRAGRGSYEKTRAREEVWLGGCAFILGSCLGFLCYLDMSRALSMMSI